MKLLIALVAVNVESRNLPRCCEVIVERMALNETSVLPPPRLREHNRRGNRKDARARRWRNTKQKYIFCTGSGHFAH